MQSGSSSGLTRIGLTFSVVANDSRALHQRMDWPVFVVKRRKNGNRYAQQSGRRRRGLTAAAEGDEGDECNARQCDRRWFWNHPDDDAHTPIRHNVLHHDQNIIIRRKWQRHRDHLEMSPPKHIPTITLLQY